MKRLFLLGLLACLAGPARAEPVLPGEPRPRITVSGEAVVKVKPDQVVLSFGVETWDRDLNLAKDSASRQEHQIQMNLVQLRLQGQMQKSLQDLDETKKALAPWMTPTR